VSADPVVDAETVEKRLAEEGGARFTNPEADEATIRGAATMADPTAHELLRELSGVDSCVRATCSRGVVNARRSPASRIALKAAGLVTTEFILQCKKSFILQCKKSSTPLTRPMSRGQLDAPTTVGDLKCAVCNQWLAPNCSARGTGLQTWAALCCGSHWVTVWVTQRFLELGVPADAIVEHRGVWGGGRHSRRFPQPTVDSAAQAPRVRARRRAPLQLPADPLPG
jgi:hypothetical protein